MSLSNRQTVTKCRSLCIFPLWGAVIIKCDFRGLNSTCQIILALTLALIMFFELLKSISFAQFVLVRFGNC